MEFSWTTFALETVNFLVLVWILRRLLYRPVLEAIEARQRRVQDVLDAADRARAETASLKRELEERAAAWDKERAQARTALTDEIAAERVRRLEALKALLEAERVSARAIEAQRVARAEREAWRKGRRDATRFCSGLLRRLAGPELQGRIVRAVEEDLGRLTGSQRQAIAQSIRSHPVAAITSASELAPEDRHVLEGALRALADRSMTYQYHTDPRLLAGLRIDVGGYAMEASLADGLVFFEKAVQRVD